MGSFEIRTVEQEMIEIEKIEKCVYILLKYGANANAIVGNNIIPVTLANYVHIERILKEHIEMEDAFSVEGVANEE
jgi:hypothetical protein